jgi:hypothetical protein
MHLCPDMNPDAVDEVSDLEFAPNRTRSPAFAADDWAALHGARSVLTSPPPEVPWLRLSQPPRSEHDDGHGDDADSDA